MTTTMHTIEDWLERIRAEYEESPGLCLTSAQARRLWGLQPLACETLLSALVEAKFLKRTGADTYVRVSNG